MKNEILLRLFGETYNGLDFIFFMMFSIFGLMLIKNIRYRKAKRQYNLLKKNPKWVFSFSKWKDENILDIVLTIMTAFATLRFLGFWIEQIPLPEFSDVMVIGFLLGLFYQYVFHKMFDKVTVTKTIDKMIK